MADSAVGLSPERGLGCSSSLEAKMLGRYLLMEDDGFSVLRVELKEAGEGNGGTDQEEI